MNEEKQASYGEHEVNKALDSVDKSIIGGYEYPDTRILAAEVRRQRNELATIQKLAAEEIDANLLRIRTLEESVRLEQIKSDAYKFCIEAFNGGTARPSVVFAPKAWA